jgi:hypothetical protein
MSIWQVALIGGVSGFITSYLMLSLMEWQARRSLRQFILGRLTGNG